MYSTLANELLTRIFFPNQAAQWLIQTHFQSRPLLKKLQSLNHFHSQGDGLYSPMYADSLPFIATQNVRLHGRRNVSSNLLTLSLAEGRVRVENHHRCPNSDEGDDA